MNLRRNTSIATFLCAMTMCAKGLLAWEQDVHQVLTYWLATQTGLSRLHADEIAKGNQSYDDSSYSSAIPTVLWILLTGDEGAARQVQEKHFASDTRLPNPPRLRIVSPNSPAARRAAEAAVRPSQEANAAFLVGESLHPLQDSWAHQGVPDVPFNLRPNLSCSHPSNRGGWWSHKADLTYLHQPEVIEVARNTYELLRAFLTNNPNLRALPTKEWSEIEPAVKEFAAARTKDQKDAWALKHLQQTASQQGFSSHLTLPGRPGQPGGTRVFRIPADRRKGLKPLAGQDAVAEAPPALVGAAQEFLDRWLVRHDIAGASESIDWTAIGDQLKAETINAEGGVMEWGRKFLVMQLVADHSEVDRAGHGNPGHPGYENLPSQVQSEGPFRAVGRAVRVALSAADFFPTDIAGPDAFGLMISVSNPSHDAVGLVWRSSRTRWSVVRMIATVE